VFQPVLTRRRLLARAAGAFAVGTVLPGAVLAGCAARMPADPFTLGVASGDPGPDGMVLWTCLAPNPLAEDGLGGMPSRPVEVEWEIADDERFSHVTRSGTVTAVPESAHTVHVEISGLPAGAEFFYRFRAEGDLDTGPLQSFGMDVWDGYVASRDRITRGWLDAGVRNMVVLTGDVHTAYANELKLDYDDPSSPTVGTELVCTSVTSGGDGADSDPATDPQPWHKPHMNFRNNQRGYVRTRFTADELRADFRVVDRVSIPDAPVRTRASFVVADREARINPA
jgi:phosphodiesterase/alkaline phosphatase D-like protein